MLERRRKNTTPLVFDITDMGVPMPLHGYKAIATLFNPDNTSIRWKKEINPIPDPDACMVCINPTKIDFDIPTGEYSFMLEIESETQHFTPIEETILIV